MKLKNIYLVIAFALLFASCASIVSKSNWPVTFNTNPNGVNVSVTNKKGKVVFTGTTPTTVKLKSGAGFFKKEAYKIKLEMGGYTT